MGLLGPAIPVFSSGDESLLWPGHPVPCHQQYLPPAQDKLHGTWSRRCSSGRIVYSLNTTASPPNIPKQNWVLWEGSDDSKAKWWGHLGHFGNKCWSTHKTSRFAHLFERCTNPQALLWCAREGSSILNLNSPNEYQGPRLMLKPIIWWSSRKHKDVSLNEIRTSVEAGELFSTWGEGLKGMVIFSPSFRSLVVSERTKAMGERNWETDSDASLDIE